MKPSTLQIGSVSSATRTYTLRALIIYLVAWAIAIATYVPFARNVRLPLWSILAVAASGAFVGVFSGRRAQLLSWSGGIWGSVCAVVAVPVLGFVGVSLLGQATFSSDIELRAVSYNHYRRQIDVSDVNPQGARSIFFYEKSRRDYRISFWRMVINEDDYLRLLDSRSRSLAADLPYCFLQEALIGSLTMNELAADPPDWWKLPPRANQLSIHAIQCDDGRGLKTYLRGVWVYDHASSMLWIVEK